MEKDFDWNTGASNFSGQYKNIYTFSPVFSSSLRSNYFSFFKYSQHIDIYIYIYTIKKSIFMTLCDQYYNKSSPFWPPPSWPDLLFVAQNDLISFMRDTFDICLTDYWQVTV